MTAPVSGPFADMAAFVADTNAINADTKTALKAALASIRGLITYSGATHGEQMAHPDFVMMDKYSADKLVAEIVALEAAITAHA